MMIVFFICYQIIINCIFSDHHGETSSIHKKSVETIETQSPISTISNSETISLIQSALQPEIERRLEARRKMDRLAMQALIQFSDPHSRTNKAEQIPLSPKEDGSNPNKTNEVYEKYSD